MKPFLVVNPKSAGGQTGRRWTALHAAASRELGEFGHAFTSGQGDATRLTRQALAEGHDAIVAVGGDGTVNEVVNGFFENGRPVAPGAAMGLVPQGTGGDFRRTFDWGLDVVEALRRVSAGRAQAIDVGLAEYLAHSGEMERRCFANVCSFGVSGKVDEEVNKSSKALGGRISFLLGTARALWKYQDRRVSLTVDGGAPEEVSVTALAVANCRYFGGGMKVAPEADPSDGWFDVTLWSGFGWGDFVLRSASLYDGSHVKRPGTRVFRCRTLEATSAEEVLLDLDGEQPGRLPCRMSLLPLALRVFR